MAGRPEGRRPESIFLPLLLIAAGALLLGNALAGRPATWDGILQFWPLLLICGALDGLYRTANLTGALLFLGLGGIFLLGNLGYVQISAWEMIIRLWPLLLIALGLDSIVGRCPSAARWIGSALGALLILSLAWLVMTTPLAGTLSHRQSIFYPLDHTDRASIVVQAVAGRLAIAGDAEPGSLAQGVVRLASRENLEQNLQLNGNRAHLTLTSRGAFYPYPLFSTSDQVGWDLHLAPDILLRVYSELTAGEQVLDFSQLQVNAFDAETTIGQTVVILPRQGGTSGRAQVTIGSLVLRLPRGAAVTIQAETFLAGVTLPEGYHRQGKRIVSPDSPTDSPINLQVRVIIGHLKVETVP